MRHPRHGVGATGSFIRLSALLIGFRRRGEPTFDLSRHRFTNFAKQARVINERAQSCGYHQRYLARIEFRVMSRLENKQLHELGAAQRGIRRFRTGRGARERFRTVAVNLAGDHPSVLRLTRLGPRVSSVQTPLTSAREG